MKWPELICNTCIYCDDHEYGCFQDFEPNTEDYCKYYEEEE